jgi:phage gp36-like protein
MADVKYITEDYARNKQAEPLGGADTEELLHAIIDATKEIDAFLLEHGVKVTLPLEEVYRTEFFKLAVACWVSGIVLMTHTINWEDGKLRKKEAQDMMLRYIATTKFTTNPITRGSSEPALYNYSNKGELKKTDLTDPLNLNYYKDD